MDSYRWILWKSVLTVLFIFLSIFLILLFKFFYCFSVLFSAVDFLFFFPLDSSCITLFLQIFFLPCQAASSSDGPGSFSPLVLFQSLPALLGSNSNFCLKVFFF